MRINLFLIWVAACLLHIVDSRPEAGKWIVDVNSESTIPRWLFAGSKVYVQVTCGSNSVEAGEMKVRWKLYTPPACLDRDQIQMNNHTEGVFPYQCDHDGQIILVEATSMTTESKATTPKDGTTLNKGKKLPLTVIYLDGYYVFLVVVEKNVDMKNDLGKLQIEIISPQGYLSAKDWPLLPFYGTMCVVYVILGIIWLTVSFLQWRDLLRIQFWVCAVILLGMLEKAMFFAEYQRVNSNGANKLSVVLFAEWVSCAKRTLARMLVIIVSLGFGIVKPRLGPMLHRVVCVGGLYFVLACYESYSRITNDEMYLIASVPLAILDSAICWWIFTSLVQTTRTLRLRRNTVKLALYRHFTNTLIFAVIASVLFMLYSIKAHRMSECVTDWKNLWLDDAFWHILFSVLLLVIMILWRPTNNNQRYAFTPLLDNPEDEDDEEEEEQFVSDAYGVKMRGPNSNNSTKPSKSANNDEDDLKWVEENIPAAINDAALPVLDSDEEIINTKFEVSKMQ
uniref:CSON009979 protein n=1 Tax=Culicoides sonorensis TaxID=179676 RepID=A0A336LKK6_CULSO